MSMPVDTQSGQPGLTARLRDMRAPLLWGVVWGGIQAASPLAFWWLDPSTVYALGLALIASIYIGFAVADGRWAVIAVESSVAGWFGVASRHWSDRSWVQGSVAAPPSVCCEHPLVAAVLPRRRLGRRCDHRRR